MKLGLCCYKIAVNQLMPVPSLQKGSPYLDDVNELIEIARQSGMIDMQFKRYLPFASKCLTYADRQEHNIEKDRTVAFKLENIYGILILFAVGLGGCVITMLAEKFVYVVTAFIERVANKIKLMKSSSEANRVAHQGMYPRNLSNLATRGRTQTKRPK